MNAAIHKIGSDEISHWVENCRKEGTSYIGTNISISGIKPKTWGVVWTENTVLYDPVTKTYSSDVSGLTPISIDPDEIPEISESQLANLLRIKNFLSRLSESGIDNEINGINNLHKARVYLKKLTRATVALTKLVDYYSIKR